jgi:CHASE2 domain-containing sensor protein
MGRRMKRAWQRIIPFLTLALFLALRVADPAAIQQARWLIFDTYQRLQPRIYDPQLLSSAWGSGPGRGPSSPA